MSINIIKCTSTANITAKSRIPKYIVVHYTAGTTSKSGTAKNTAIYFSKPATKASADFIVDDSNIVQYNPDPTKYYCWSVGGSKYRTMSTSEGGKYYRIVTNSNSVSIEICSSKINKKSLSASDTDWYFTDEVIERAIELTKYLMDLYNIPIENVIMHHSVNGKVCPNPFCVNESALNKWKEFKNRVNSYSTTSNSTPSQPSSSTNTSITINQFTPLKGNPNHFAEIIKNIKIALNVDYGLKFTIDSSINDILLINLENVVLSTTAYKKNITYALQQLLTWWGYSLTIDGIYGSGTKSIITLFQSQVGIAQTGTTTKEFWYKILGK